MKNNVHWLDSLVQLKCIRHFVELIVLKFEEIEYVEASEPAIHQFFLLKLPLCRRVGERNTVVQSSVIRDPGKYALWKDLPNTFS